MFDLTILPLHIRDNQEQPDLPGLAAYPAPRRSARGRADDQLVILFSLNGNAPLSSDGLQQLLDRLAEVYFGSPGSVTMALRGVADTLNQYLLERNLRNTTTGRQAIGLLNLVAIHSQVIYLAQAGQTHTFLISAGEVQHWHDPQPGSRGLGLSKTTGLRFFQAEIQNGDRLLLCSEAPTTWRADTLHGAYQLNIDQLRRRLLTPRPLALNAGLLLLQTGSGVINRVKPPTPDEFVQAPSLPLDLEGVDQPVQAPPAPVIEHHPQPEEQTQETEFPEIVSTQTSAPLQADRPVQLPASPSLDILPEPRSPRRQPDIQPPARRPATEPQPVVQTPLQTHRPDPKTRPATPSRAALPILQAVSNLLHGEQRLRHRTGQSIKGFFQRILPGKSDDPNSLSSGTMVFVAIAVPLMIVIVALIVYNQRGRTQQYQDYLSLAAQSALAVQGQTDPTLLKTAWTNTLQYLDQADLALPDQPDSLALREQAQTELDKMEGVVRLPFQEAIQGGLSATANVTQMLATSTELYMLNTAQGRVIRAMLSGGVYQVDAGFNCSSGQVDTTVIGNLVDITSAPKGLDTNASVLAIDDTGMLIYCTPGSPPKTQILTPPDGNWGNIQAITMDNAGLYVLDAVNNAVWVYTSANNYQDAPALFFGSEVPPLIDAIDLAINGDDLVVLHSDGHLSQCTATYSGEYDTRCSVPAPFSDARTGQTLSLAVLPETHFTQLQFTQPPDPSYYLLDVSQDAIFHFSLRLSLQRQMRTLASPYDNFPEGEPTAFTISPNRLAFIAFGSHIFVSQLP